MRSVPAFIAPLVLGEQGAQALSGCGVRLGEAVELDLDAVCAVAGQDVAQALAEYFTRCCKFWAKGPQGPFISIRRLLFSDRQSTTKVSRRDLDETLSSLNAVPGLGAVMDLLLDREVDVERLQVIGTPFALDIQRDGLETVATLHLRPGHLPIAGVATLGEVRRVVVVGVNHAAWRDRKVRRLERVNVHADEIWPDPRVLASSL